MKFRNRELFLEDQISLYRNLIDDLENSRMNGKEKKDLEIFKNLYSQYMGEYKSLSVSTSS
jgi:hypothetical protein